MYDGCANKKKVNIFKIKEDMPKKIALSHDFLFFYYFCLNYFLIFYRFVECSSSYCYVLCVIFTVFCEIDVSVEPLCCQDSIALFTINSDVFSVI